MPTGCGGWWRQTKAGTSGRPARVRSIQASWSGPRYPAGLPSVPDPARPQQMHFDVMVEDVAASGPRVLALGARKLGGEGVYADPAGHPFCLIPRPAWAPPVPS